MKGPTMEIRYDYDRKVYGILVNAMAIETGEEFMAVKAQLMRKVEEWAKAKEEKA